MKPLEGLRVIDLTQAMAAPYCTMNLADMGADVIKVEPPGGEETRRGSVQRNGHSGAFNAINRNKRSLTVDLKQRAGVEIIHRLTRTADVFVQNYRPGAAARLGVAYEELSALNPRLIYCSISGFGATGPYAARGGYDLIAQGMSGIISLTGDEGGPPAKAGVPLSDLAAGLFGAYGILSALEHRERTGRGQLVDTSLLEAAMALTVCAAADYWTTGRVPTALGSADRHAAPQQALRASDGLFVVAVADDAGFERFCRALARPDLLTDARFRSPEQRLAHRAALAAEVERTTRKEPRTYWLGRLDAEGVPAGPVNTCPEALADPHTLARGMVVDLVHPGAGPIKNLGVPVKLSDTPGAVDRPAPLLGEHHRWRCRHFVRVDELVDERLFEICVGPTLREALELLADLQPELEERPVVADVLREFVVEVGQELLPQLLDLHVKRRGLAAQVLARVVVAERDLDVPLVPRHDAREALLELRDEPMKLSARHQPLRSSDTLASGSMVRISAMEIIGRKRTNRNSSEKNRPIVPMNVDQSQNVGA